MKRFAIVALVAILAACGSDNNGPTDKFTGHWNGIARQDEDSLVFDFQSTQNGSATTGSGTAASGGSQLTFTFTGTSTPPTVNMTLNVSGQTLVYNGSYVSSDSISGTIYNTTNPDMPVVLDLGKR